MNVCKQRYLFFYVQTYRSRKKFALNYFKYLKNITVSMKIIIGWKQGKRAYVNCFIEVFFTFLFIFNCLHKFKPLLHVIFSDAENLRSSVCMNSQIYWILKSLLLLPFQNFSYRGDIFTNYLSTHFVILTLSNQSLLWFSNTKTNFHFEWNFTPEKNTLT